jgi:hypothetical protein
MLELAIYEQLLSRLKVTGLLNTGLSKVYEKWRPDARVIRQKNAGPCLHMKRRKQKQR